MRKPAHKLLSLYMLLGALLLPAPILAAEVPQAAETIDLSPPVANGLNAVIALLDAQKLDDAASAMQELRAELQAGMSAYEQQRTLQLSALVHTLRQMHAEAIADYEALLALPTLTEAERLDTANLAAQLYLQQEEWSKALVHLEAVNEMQNAGDRETLYRIMFAYNQLGQPAAAIPFMEQSLELAGAEATEEDYNRLAQLYLGAEENAKAIATYEKLLAHAPDTANRESVFNNLAFLYSKEGNNLKAASTLRILLREFPTSGQASAWRQSLAVLEAAGR